jgi:hypothetical protein
MGLIGASTRTAIGSNVASVQGWINPTRVNGILRGGTPHTWSGYLWPSRSIPGQGIPWLHFLNVTGICRVIKLPCDLMAA